MDACLWLLRNGVDPDRISWIMPRDSWLLDRANIQPGEEFFDQATGGFARQINAVAEAQSIDGLFAALEDCGQLLRLDPAVRPTMFRCATVTVAELLQLRRIPNVIRLGRVRRITPRSIELDEGNIETTPHTLHVDCSTDGLARRPVEPIFAGPELTLQSVRTCQQVFSAAFIAHVEASLDADAEKNALCAVVPHPDSEIDWLRTTLANSRNQFRWNQDAGLRRWLSGARLDGFSRTFVVGDTASAEQRAVLRSIIENLPAAVANLERLLTEHDRAERAADS